ncbi:MAG: response regulator [Candidatus Eisenbacteria bacterium]
MSTELCVLLVEDSEDDAALILRELTTAGFDVKHERVTSESALHAALGRRRWDIVIGDYNLPGFSGAAALEVLRQREPDVPFLFVSGTMGEDLAVAAMKSGANDYVMKDNLRRLVPAIERELREAASRRERDRLEEQLRLSQRLEVVGRLAGGVAHDFNNLLTVMSGRCEFLIGSLAPNDSRREEVTAIQDAVERASGLTRQLLAFGRRQVVELRANDVNSIVSGMELMLRRLIGEHIEMHSKLSPSAGAVWADRSQLEQMVLNLVVNARDAMPEGGRLMIETAAIEMDEYYVVAHPLAQPGLYTLLAVSDSGAGMDAATQARIFEPYFSTKPSGKGSGLGLAMVYGIVKQSGGFIWVYSEPGLGTTLKVYLPQTELPVEVVVTPPTPRSMSGTETILLVEDEPALRDLFKRTLESQGYNVVSAPDGQAARGIDADIDGEVHLLLTDVVMPHVGGRELATSLRIKRPGLRVLYMSGYTDDAVIRNGVLEPASAFLQKPFTPAALAQKVREVLETEST